VAISCPTLVAVRTLVGRRRKPTVDGAVIVAERRDRSTNRRWAGPARSRRPARVAERRAERPRRPDDPASTSAATTRPPHGGGICGQAKCPDVAVEAITAIDWLRRQSPLRRLKASPA
jgi:hypothetical protein